MIYTYSLFAASHFLNVKHTKKNNILLKFIKENQTMTEKEIENIDYLIAKL